MPEQTDQEVNIKQGQFSSYDVFILIITIMALIVMVVHYLPNTDATDTNIAFMLDNLFSLVFLYDFFRRLSRAKDRKGYLFKRGGWLDLLGSFPAFPILRLLRIWRMWRILLKMRGMTLKEIWRRYRADKVESIFWSTALVTILFISVSSFLIVRLESSSPEAQITTSGDALWWAIVTVTTVGYGDLVPVTQDGRLLASVLITVGVALVSVLTSYFTTQLIARRDPQGDQDRDEILASIENLNKRLERIESMLKNTETGDKE
jgi:voltage-gated potassium channel